MHYPRIKLLGFHQILQWIPDLQIKKSCRWDPSLPLVSACSVQARECHKPWDGEFSDRGRAYHPVLSFPFKSLHINSLCLGHSFSPLLPPTAHLVNSYSSFRFQLKISPPWRRLAWLPPWSQPPPIIHTQLLWNSCHTFNYIMNNVIHHSELSASLPSTRYTLLLEDITCCVCSCSVNTLNRSWHIVGTQ